MLRWIQRLHIRPKHTQDNARRPANSTVRVLAITGNDQFYSSLVDAATSHGWEIRRASSLTQGLEITRSLRMPLVLFDWDENGDDWREALQRLVRAPGHPTVLLASRLADENMRQEVIRLQGYDVLPRSADRDRMVRTIQFAWFWITRSNRFHDGAEQKEEPI
jgi:DNA-binding response OmpR family regulator